MATLAWRGDATSWADSRFHRAVPMPPGRVALPVAQTASEDGSRVGMSAPRSAPVEVCIRVVPWLTRAFGHRGAGWLTLVRAVSPGTSLADLLWGLAREYPGFAEYALGRDGSLPCPYVCLALNDEAVATRAELGRELRDGDRVLLLLALGGD